MGVSGRRSRCRSRVMWEPGLDRHEWESEMQGLEDDMRENPAEALPELDALVLRMLEQTGYDLGDPVAREGEEREIVAEYLAAREITQASERGSEAISPGDIAAAINGYRAVYDYIVANRSAVDADITLSGEVEEKFLRHGGSAVLGSGGRCRPPARRNERARPGRRGGAARASHRRSSDRGDDAYAGKRRGARDRLLHLGRAAACGRAPT